MRRHDEEKRTAARDAEYNKLAGVADGLRVDFANLLAVVGRFEADLAAWRAGMKERDAPPIAPAQEWSECKLCGDAFYPGERCHHNDPKCPMVKK